MIAENLTTSSQSFSQLCSGRTAKLVLNRYATGDYKNTLKLWLNSGNTALNDNRQQEIEMKKVLRIAFSGFTLWLICFLIAVIVWPLHASQFMLFKSIMIVSGSVSGMWLLARHFKKVRNDYVKEGIIVGGIWFIVNIGLDLIVLVAILKSPLVEYLISPGIGYLCIPAMCIGVGYAISNNRKTNLD